MDKRRFFSKLYIILLTCLLILPCSKDVIGADWIYLCSSDFSLYYYDAESINFLPNNIIRVWVKNIPTDAAASQSAYSVMLREINCKYDTSDILAWVDYNDKDEVISSGKSEKPEP